MPHFNWHSGSEGIDGNESIGEGTLQELVARLPVTVRLDFANRYLEVRRVPRFGFAVGAASTHAEVGIHRIFRRLPPGSTLLGLERRKLVIERDNFSNGCGHCLTGG